MLTTMGKIPSEMYDLEDTSPPVITKLVHFEKTSPFARAIAVTEPQYHPVTKEPTGHSSILIALLTALLIIFLLCCITACIITKSKRKSVSYSYCHLNEVVDVGWFLYPFQNVYLPNDVEMI